jgi:DNA-binding MarR family transcriptional regulator
MDNIKTPYKLSEKQINLLTIIYRFRFVTALLVGQYKDITAQSMKRSLNILEDSGYIDKRYNSSYKLQGKSTRYFLSPKAIKLFKDNEDINQHSLNLFYKTKLLSEEACDSHIQTLQTYIDYRAKLTGNYTLKTKYELYNNEDQPDPPSDIYAQSNKNQQSDIFIEIHNNKQNFIIQKRLTYLAEFIEDNYDDNQPKVILITNKNNKKIGKIIENLSEEYSTQFLNLVALP